MNHFSYEVMSKEKIQDMQAEGLRSQAFFKSGASKPGLWRGLPKIIVGLLGILGLLSLLVR